ncbi:unnamed protein product, partial [marine sediment metagenome]
MPRYDNNNTGFVNRELKLPLNLKWEFRTSAVVKANLVGNSYFIVAGDLAGNLYLLNSISGKKLSKKRIKGEFVAPPVLVDSL